MSEASKTRLAFALVAVMLIIIGFAQSWNVALGILNLCLISAVMALGVNMQWGYAGLLTDDWKRRQGLSQQGASNEDGG